MSTNTKIEWCDHTDNLWHGCVKVHTGCDHCYAETFSKRWKRDIWGNDKPRMIINSVWNDLKRQQRDAAAEDVIRRVFVGSMMDIAEKPMPLINHKGEPAIDANDGSPIYTDHLRDRLFSEISADMYHNLFFLLLSKRPSNFNKYTPESWKQIPPLNVMFGTSPVDQATFDNLWLHLARVNGKRFLSMEPLVGPVRLKSYCSSCDKLLIGSLSKVCGTCHSETIRPDWVIIGGESGNASDIRKMNPEWAYDIIKQCTTFDVPVFFKQAGVVLAKEWNCSDSKGGIIEEFPPLFRIRQLPKLLTIPAE